MPELDAVEHDLSKALHPENVTTFPAILAARMKDGKGIPGYLNDSYDGECWSSAIRISCWLDLLISIVVLLSETL